MCTAKLAERGVQTSVMEKVHKRQGLLRLGTVESCGVTYLQLPQSDKKVCFIFFESLLQ